MGAKRFNQEHKTHSAYHDPRVSGRVPVESWRALEGLGGFREGPGRSWRVWEGFLESPGESGRGSGRVLAGLGKVLGGGLGMVLGMVLRGS